MNCDLCGHETTVIDSRPEKNDIRRRRKCVWCGARFTSYEIRADAMAQVVVISKFTERVRAHKRDVEKRFEDLISALEMMGGDPDFATRVHADLVRDRDAANAMARADATS